MEHYQELGVGPGATTAEIRASYLALARRFHPDRLSDQSPQVRADAAARMARINAAWTVLGDTARRARYDAIAFSQATATVRDASNAWMPLDPDDDVDDALLDDTPSGAPTLRKALTFLPAGLLTAGAFSVVVGAVVALVPLVAAGLVLVAGAGLAFLALPLVVLARASRADRL